MGSKGISPVLEELLPGIPYDVALEEIATKLSWRDTHTLSSVSRRWQYGMRSREVYDARVRRNSTERLVVLLISDFYLSNSESDRNNGLHGQFFLHSLTDKSFYQLPSMPLLLVGFEFIALDGRLYVLGGVNGNHKNQSVFVLDVAGERQWKRCASMLEPRHFFGCGVMNGRIYVFGGCSTDGPMTPLCGSEMYDPTVDAWFPIKPLSTGLMLLGVTCTGQELIVHSGFGIDYEAADLWQVYCPRRDDWRIVEPLSTRIDPQIDLPIARRLPFLWQGNIYSVTSDGIHVYDGEQKSWTYRYSPISCDGLRPVESVRLYLLSLLPVNTELLAIMWWKRTDNGEEGQCLLQSSGFGSQKDDVVWSRASSSFRVPGVPDMHSWICPIEL